MPTMPMTPAQVVEYRRRMETLTHDKRMAREIETALFPSGHKEGNGDRKDQEEAVDGEDQRPAVARDD